MDEFSLIRHYFTRTPRHASAILGVGDDAALWRPLPGLELAVAADMLVADRHFFADDDAFDVGWKALAVNVSDMAAMGAQPRAVTLCLALPAADPAWLQRFAEGFWSVADAFGVDLVGGDTTRGPLTIAIQIWGEVPAGAALRRDGAHEGDDIWVSGAVGTAAAGLLHLQGRLSLDGATLTAALDRLRRPVPRVGLGLALRGLAHAAIDISDGLVADLGHILTASGCGGLLDFAQIPLVPGLHDLRATPAVRDAILGGGDDYELCFTAAPQHRTRIGHIGVELGLSLTRIGTVVGGSDVFIQGENGEQLQYGRAGYNHFAGEGA